MKRAFDPYRASVVVAAAATAAIVAAVLGPAPADPARVLAVIVLGTAALQFPLHFSLTTKVSPAAAVFFAAVLVLPPAAAAAAVALTEALSTAISVVRRVVGSRQAPPARRVLATLLFNAAASYLAVLAAGLLLFATGARAGAGDARFWLAAAAAAVVMHVANLLFVSVAEGLRSETSAWRIFTDTNRAVGPHFAVLYAVGAAAAVLSYRYLWVPAAMVLPMAVVYAALARAVQMSRDTIRAVERMAEMVDRRDPYTFQHSHRVADYSVRIASRLRLGREDVELLRLAGTVHDLGKIAIPDSVLLKPGRLNAEEEAQMRSHPRAGYEILSEFRDYAKVRELVLTHHERFAGGGYPNGILAGGLPLVAQVIPVADSLDAMTTARPYRGPLSWTHALGELERGAGSQWNPKVVAAALAVFADRREAEAEPELRPALAAV